VGKILGGCIKTNAQKPHFSGTKTPTNHGGGGKIKRMRNGRYLLQKRGTKNEPQLKKPGTTKGGGGKKSHNQ